MHNYAWPGNVRELSNAIEGAFTFDSSGTIRREDLPPGVSGLAAAKVVASSERTSPVTVMPSAI